MHVAALALAWLLGTYLALGGVFDPGAWPLLLALAACSTVSVGTVWGAARLRMVALAMLFLLLGASRALLAEDVLVHDPLKAIEGNVELVATVARPPEQRGISTTAVLDVHARRTADGWVGQEGKAWMSTFGGTPLTYGDAVLVRGLVAEPDGRAGSPLPAILRRQGIRYALQQPEVTLIERRPGSVLWEGLQEVRIAIGSAIRSELPEPHASLLAGVLVGTRAGIPSDLRDALIASGTSHLVAVSGFHVAVVAGLVALALSHALGRRRALIPSLLAVALYTLLTGPQPSAVRGALMVGAAMLAASAGRLPDPLTSLLLVGSLMLLFDPLLGLDVGFQLSFAATAGLILVRPVIVGWLSPLPTWIREPLAVPVAAQIATLPVIASTFHQVSIVAPISNLLIAPVLSVLMPLGGLLALASPIDPVAAVIAWPAWLVAGYVVGVIQSAGSLPGALVPVGQLTPLTTAMLYGGVVALCMLGLPEARAALARLPVPNAGRLAMVLVVGLMGLLPVGATAVSSSGALRVVALDMGSGLSVLARTPSGRSILFVGPASSARLSGALSEHLRPWESHISLVALSNVEDAARVEALLGRFSAERVVVLGGPDGLDGADSQVPGLVVLPGGGVLELDHDLTLSGLPAGQGIGWRLTHGTVEVAIVGPPGAQAQSGRAPLAGTISAQVGAGNGPPRLTALIATTSDVGDAALALPRSLLVSADGARGVLPTSPSLLTARLHGEIELISNGSELTVRSSRCAEPFQKSGCTFILEGLPEKVSSSAFRVSSPEYRD